MAEYNGWMNTRLYDAAARLPEAELFADRHAFFGSLFETLNHVAVADTIWLHRFAQQPELGWMADALASFPRPSSLTQRLAGSLVQLRESGRGPTRRSPGSPPASPKRSLPARSATPTRRASRKPGTSGVWCSTSSTTRRTIEGRRRRSCSRRGWMWG
jgi:hypothetical protein